VSLADELADYFYSVRYSDLGKETVRQAKRRIIDALGCAIGAYGEAPVRIARRVATESRSRRPATLLGSKEGAPVELATFVNGFMVRYFDFNDTYLSKEPAHPSDNLGATLSVSDAESRSGRDLILSTVLAYEIQSRLCDAADIRHRGWDHVNYGLVSTALAGSRLMGSSKAKAAQAVNIALNAHIAMRQVRAGELSMWKGASFANAARNGVFAALLAREGMTGPAPIFEGEMGFFKQVSGSFELDIGSFGGRGGEFVIGRTYIKYWPAEYHSQSAIWAALELRKEIEDVGEVESVLIESHEAGYTILGRDPEKWRPSTKETADHSLPYIVGMALLEGRVTNATYSQARFMDRENLEFVRKISVREDPSLTALYPDRGMANRITVVLKDGRRLTREVVIPRGHPANPMTDGEIEEKFIRLTRRYLGNKRTKRVLEKLWALEECKDLNAVFDLLAVRE